MKTSAQQPAGDVRRRVWCCESRRSYQRGAASLLDYLDAERSYRQTELAYRQALSSYLLALEQLREAVGTRTLP